MHSIGWTAGSSLNRASKVAVTLKTFKDLERRGIGGNLNCFPLVNLDVDLDHVARDELSHP